MNAKLAVEIARMLILYRVLLIDLHLNIEYKVCEHNLFKGFHLQYMQSQGFQVQHMMHNPFC